MKFPSSRLLSAKHLAQLIREGNRNGERFCFILGSGASVESGIPSGNKLELQWMNCLMGEKADQGTLAMDAGETQRIATALRAEGAIEHDFPEIEAAWQKAKAGEGPIPSEYYFDIYKLRFHANAWNGYSYLEKIMEHRDPSLGYHTLAKLLTEGILEPSAGNASEPMAEDGPKLPAEDSPEPSAGDAPGLSTRDDSEPSVGDASEPMARGGLRPAVPGNLNNLVITTNFDSLVEDALFLYTDKKPLVVSHESLTGYIEANIQRPIIAKVHRGLMYAPFNSPETTHELKKEWRDALSHVFNTYTPIVIGYAGGDRSLMAFLEEKATIMRHGVYWCFRGKVDQPKLPGENIQKFVLNKKGYFVAIDGFDALMMEIGKTLYGDAIRPGRTEERLREKNEGRIQRYREQWDELSKDPEVKEVLQSMNKKEQQEETEREKKEELTAQDYIRRGRLAKEKGDLATAIEEYSKALKKDTKNTSAYISRGLAYYDRGEYAKAIDDCGEAIKLNPSLVAPYNNRGLAYEKLGRYEEAISDYSKALELSPDYIKAYNNRGLVYEALEQHEEAISDYSKALELSPSYVRAYNNRGLVYKGLRRYEEALNDYNKALALSPGYTKAYNNRGSVYHSLGDNERALADYNKAIELDPANAIAHFNQGNTYYSLKQYKEAVKSYTRAIELNPQYKKAYRARAKAYRLLNQADLAEADDKAAAEL